VKQLVSFLLVALVAGAVSGGALAKGPIEAEITGPGLGSPTRIGDRDSFGDEDALAPHQPIMQLAEAAGFFLASFGGPDVLDRRPAGELGPRYRVEYRVPGPDGEEFRIVQELYPYAEPDPVSYTAPGQSLFEPEGTRGGWYVAAGSSGHALLSVLAEAGLPGSPAGTAAEPERFPWSIVLAAALLCAVLAGAAATWARRRQQPATSP
jgi:hypothetical protein